ncbi:MAG: hypothetical protein ABH886_09870 [Candidatus Desantisbacteria bacterium]
MSNKLLISLILILSFCTIVRAEDIAIQEDSILNNQSQVEDSSDVAPELPFSPIIHDSTPILHATIFCDMPPADFQEQIKQLGARILKVGRSISGEDAVIDGDLVEVEVQEYESLYNIGQLNFVMRIDGVKELVGIVDKLSERE